MTSTPIICMSKKAAAIRAGAIVTDKFGPVEHVAKLDIASGDQWLAKRGRKAIERIERARAAK